MKNFKIETLFYFPDGEINIIATQQANTRKQAEQKLLEKLRINFDFLTPEFQSIRTISK